MSELANTETPEDLLQQLDDPDLLNHAKTWSKEELLDREKAIARLKAYREPEETPVGNLLNWPLEELISNANLVNDYKKYFTLYAWERKLDLELDRVKGLAYTNEADRDKYKRKIYKKKREINRLIGGNPNVADKKNNQLHCLIWRVVLQMQKRPNPKPTAQSVWNEIRFHHKEHDVEGIIQEVTPDEIFWRSGYRNEQILKRASFDKTLSILKKHPPQLEQFAVDTCHD